MQEQRTKGQEEVEVIRKVDTPGEKMGFQRKRSKYEKGRKGRKGEKVRYLGDSN